MHNLLVWQLRDDYKIIFSSQGASLSTVTCCDSIDISFYGESQKYLLATTLTGCSLSSFKKELDLFVQGVVFQAKFNDIFVLRRSEIGIILLEISKDDQILGFFIISFDDIQSWISQLELLEILMQENENERKNRNNGCCG
ncbi:hypothetical protein HYV10_01040 [Candidatus Dependentiae bacterium]|nr:hypothetical protein [Candidatus Dependentiae bacterium]